MPLKMPTETQEHLREGFARLGQDAIRDHGISYKQRGLSLQRFLWDMFWAATHVHPFPRVEGNQYTEGMPWKGGVNDSHIESFLRQELAKFYRTEAR